ncbi:MAG: polysaccharide deacetylase family protein [Flavobacteriia bacterium]
MKKSSRYILNFHSVYNDEISFHSDNVYSIHQGKLVEIFKFISKNNIDVDITFDDGHLSDYGIVIPVLKEFKLNAVFFVIGKEIDVNFEKRNQTKLIYQEGYEIGSHGFNHIDLRKLSDFELDLEIRDSKTLIEDTIKNTISSFSIPMGLYDKRVVEKIKSHGFHRIYTTDGFLNYKDDLLQHRINVKNNCNLYLLESILLQNNLFNKGVFHAKLKLKKTIKNIIQ